MDKPFHAIGGLLPHLLGDMTVNVQREAGGGMTQIALHGLDVISAFDGDNCVAVPLRYNNDKPEESRIFKGFQGFQPDF